MEEFKVSLGVQLNNAQFDTVKRQLSAMSQTKYKAKIDLDTSRVQSQINNIKRQIQNLSGIKINLSGVGVNTGGNRGVASGLDSQVNMMNSSYKKMLSIQKKMGSLQIKIGSLKGSGRNNEITELETQLKNLKVDYDAMAKTLNQKTLSTNQWDRLQESIENTQLKLKQLDARYLDTKQKMAQGIANKLNTDAFSNQISTINAKFDGLKNKTAELKGGMSSLNKSFADMQMYANSGNIDGLISSNSRYNTELAKMNNLLTIATREQRGLADAEKLTQQQANMSLKMDIWLKENSSATKMFGERIRKLQLELKDCDATRLNGIKNEFRQIAQEAELAGKTTKTFGDRIKQQFERFGVYLSTAMVFTQIIAVTRDAYENVKNIDSAMTELKKVTNETADSYNNFLKGSGTVAKEIGTTVTDYISSTADFARLGYSYGDSQELSKVANIYNVVGDEIDSIEDASQSLISTMTAFNVTAEDSISIVDKMNEVSNNFAISSGGIGEALQRSASSMYSANNTLDETIALITSANTVVQDPEMVGTAFKTNLCLYVQKCA